MWVSDLLHSSAADESCQQSSTKAKTSRCWAKSAPCWTQKTGGCEFHAGPFSPKQSLPSNKSTIGSSRVVFCTNAIALFAVINSCSPNSAFFDQKFDTNSLMVPVAAVTPEQSGVPHKHLGKKVTSSQGLRCLSSTLRPWFYKPFMSSFHRSLTWLFHRNSKWIPMVSHGFTLSS